MRRFIPTVCLTLHLLCAAPPAHAAGDRDPLDAPLREWGAVIGLSLLGGAASWINRVRTGQLRDASLMSLAGEGVIAGFAGVLAYLGCQAAGLGPAVTYFLAGVAGHLGAEGIKWMERAAKRRAEALLGARADAAQEAPRG